MSFDITKPKADNRKQLRQVTDWVEDELPDALDDVTVMVNEMQCFEPNCPPLETVVTLLGAKSIVFKLFKPVAEVTQMEVVESTRAAISGETMAQHVGDAAAAGAMDDGGEEWVCGDADDMDDG